MDVTTEMVATREVEFTVRPEPERVDDAKRKAARNLSKRVRIPGFRPGKAPFGLVERTVGKEYLTEEAADLLAPDLYKEILEEGGYDPYDRPTLTIAEQEPLALKIRVPLRPTVELPDYCAMEVEPEPPVEVTAEQEEELLKEVREQHGTWVPVERAAQMGDQVTLDIRGTSDDEVVFDEEGTEIVLSEELSPPGFAEQVVGMELGQTRQFSLAYPEDYAQRDVAGKTLEFTVTLRELKERELPELNDEFAQSLGDYETLDDLKARLKDGLRNQLETDARNRFSTRVLDQVVEQTKLEYPNIALEQEIDSLVQQRETRLRQQGFTLESYLQVVHKSLPQFRDELRPEAEESLRRELTLREVAKAEKLEVKPEEVMAEVNRVSAAYGEQAESVRQAFMQDAAVASLWNDMLLRQALSRLVDVVTGKVEGVCAPPEVTEAEAAAAEAPEAEAPEAEGPATTEAPGEEAAEEAPTE